MNDVLRLKCMHLIKTYGTPKSFIAAKIGVTKTTIGNWLQYERNLSEDKLTKLDNWLETLN